LNGACNAPEPSVEGWPTRSSSGLPRYHSIPESAGGLTRGIEVGLRQPAKRRYLLAKPVTFELRTRRSVVVIDTDMNLRPAKIPGRWVLARVLPPSRAALVHCRLEKDGPGQAVLSSSSHRTARTGTIAGSVVVNASIRPPPPNTGVFRAFLRMHRPLTSMFGRRFLCLWGQFVGTYSALAYAACAGGADASGPYAAFSRPRRGWAMRCIGMHRACVCSCTDQSASGCYGVISTSAEMTAGRLRRRVVTRWRYAWLPASVP
jgi:hypothetical protein